MEGSGCDAATQEGVCGPEPPNPSSRFNNSSASCSPWLRSLSAVSLHFDACGGRPAGHRRRFKTRTSPLQVRAAARCGQKAGLLQLPMVRL